MAETLGDRIKMLLYMSDPFMPLDDATPVADYAAACEALALAAAARVEAEAREGMAAIMADRAFSREPYPSEHGGRWARRRLARDKAGMAVEQAHQAECAALARWQEVTGG